MSRRMSHASAVLPLWPALGLRPAPLPAQAQRPAPREPGLIRVCADPDNMPSSNDKGEGFENKIAELIADGAQGQADLRLVSDPPRLFPDPERDVLRHGHGGAGRASTWPASTKPYFRSGYVFVARQGSGLEDLNSLADPRLKKLKIGVNMYTSDAENSPPAMALSRYGVVGNLTGLHHLLQ